MIALAITFLRQTWKIWLPMIAFVLVAGTIYAQHQQIKSLKSQRDVAVVEHERAIEEQKQLLNDIDRLNKVLLHKQEVARNLEVQLEESKNRIRRLAANRPDVADWRNSALPSGLWNEAIGIGASDGDPSRADASSSGSANGADNKR